MFQALYIYEASFYVKNEKKGKKNQVEEKSKELKISDYLEFNTRILWLLDIKKRNAGRVLSEKISPDVKILKEAIFPNFW